MKRLRWLLLVLVAVAAPIALAPLIPLRPKIEARLSELFNREVQISSMRLSLLGGPHLTMKRVTIKAATLANWLGGHSEIEIVTRDRASYYADGINEGAPEAVQIADRWHFQKNLRRHGGDAKTQSVADTQVCPYRTPNCKSC